jgi:hypothetical protein
VALLVALSGVGFIITRRGGIETTLIILGAPIVLALAFTQLEYGSLLLLFAALFIRFVLPTGTHSDVVASMALTGLVLVMWLARMLIVEKRIYLNPSIANVPIFGFIGAVIFSYAWSNAFRDPLVVVWSSWPFVQLGALAEMILLPCAFILTANLTKDMRTLRGAVVLITVGMCIYLLGFFLRSVIPSMAATIHAVFAFVNVRGLFSMWFGALVYAQLLFNKQLSLWTRIILVGLLTAWGYRFFVVGITWLAGWLVPASAIAAVTFFRSKKLFLLFMVLVLVFLGLKWEYWMGTVVANEADESGYSRMRAYRQNWNVTGKHLLFGTGPAGYAAYYMTYFPGAAMASHSDYIDLLAQTGIVGLLSYLAFFGTLLWTGYKLIRRLNGRRDFTEAFANAVLAGCAGCMLAMAVGTWLVPFVYTASLAGFDHAVYSWIMLGAMVALEHLVARVQGADEALVVT